MAVAQKRGPEEALGLLASSFTEMGQMVKAQLGAPADQICQHLSVPLLNAIAKTIDPSAEDDILEQLTLA